MKPLYETLSRQAILSVKADQVATFLGKKITPQLAQELGSSFATRIEGTCIKHRLGKVSVKMYYKFGRVLRLETTTYEVSFFKHYRKVEHRDPRTRNLDLAVNISGRQFHQPDYVARIASCISQCGIDASRL